MNYLQNTMNNYYTYEICSSKNPNIPFYIGKGKTDRMFVHEKSAIKRSHRNKYLEHKILKILNLGYHLVYKKLKENISEKDALLYEINRIEECKNQKIKLCNLTNGGEGVSGFRSEETKRKMKGKIPWNKGKHTGHRSKETIEKIKRNHVPLFGNTFASGVRTNKTKLKMKLSAKFRPKVSKESKYKMHISALNRWRKLEK